MSTLFSAIAGMQPNQRTYVPDPTVFEKVSQHPFFLVRHTIPTIFSCYSHLTFVVCTCILSFAQPTVAWITWLVLGMCFYCKVNNLGWAKGFYMAVNVGYSIGWGYPVEIDDKTRLFSIAYVLIGAAAASLSLVMFAKNVIQSCNDWYAVALKSETAEPATLKKSVQVWFKQHCYFICIVVSFVAILTTLVVISALRNKWDLSQAFYFALTACTTGGLWRIPDDSPDWYFGLGNVPCAFDVSQNIVVTLCERGPHSRETTEFYPHLLLTHYFVRLLFYSGHTNRSGSATCWAAGVSTRQTSHLHTQPQTGAKTN